MQTESRAKRWSNESRSEFVLLLCVASDCSLLFLKKGDPPADLRDADGFCYRLIRTVLSENLLHFDCKNNVFFLELYKISISFLCVFFSVCGNIFLIFSADARTLCLFLISRMTIRTVTRRTHFIPDGRADNDFKGTRRAAFDTGRYFKIPSHEV